MKSQKVVLYVIGALALTAIFILLGINIGLNAQIKERETEPVVSESVNTVEESMNAVEPAEEVQDVQPTESLYSNGEKKITVDNYPSTQREYTPELEQYIEYSYTVPVDWSLDDDSLYEGNYRFEELVDNAHGIKREVAYLFSESDEFNVTDNEEHFSYFEIIPCGSRYVNCVTFYDVKRDHHYAAFTNGGNICVAPIESAPFCDQNGSLTYKNQFLNPFVADYEELSELVYTVPMTNINNADFDLLTGDTYGMCALMGMYYWDRDMYEVADIHVEKMSVEDNVYYYYVTSSGEAYSDIVINPDEGTVYVKIYNRPGITDTFPISVDLLKTDLEWRKDY